MLDGFEEGFFLGMEGNAKQGVMVSSIQEQAEQTFGGRKCEDE